MENIKHSDFDLNFLPHPLTGDIGRKTNVEAIRQNVLNLFYLSPYDIPFDSSSSNLSRYLFEPITTMTSANLKKRLEWVIKTFEKRITIMSIDVEDLESDNGYNITIVYKIKSLGLDDTIQHFFQRIR